MSREEAWFSRAKNNVFVSGYIKYNQSIQNTTTNALSAKIFLVCITHWGKSQLFVHSFNFVKNTKIKDFLPFLGHSHFVDYWSKLNKWTKNGVLHTEAKVNFLSTNSILLQPQKFKIFNIFLVGHQNIHIFVILEFLFQIELMDKPFCSKKLWKSLNFKTFLNFYICHSV